MSRRLVHILLMPEGDNGIDARRTPRRNHTTEWRDLRRTPLAHDQRDSCSPAVSQTR
jgi:hypothetical protein